MNNELQKVIDLLGLLGFKNNNYVFHLTDNNKTYNFNFHSFDNLSCQLLLNVYSKSNDKILGLHTFLYKYVETITTYNNADEFISHIKKEFICKYRKIKLNELKN